MLIKFPKDTLAIQWTNHIKNKMLFYGLSEGRIRRVMQSPKRVEEGIAPSTVAAMQRNDHGKKKEEIWVMYQQMTHAKKLTTNNTRESRKLKVVSYTLGAKLRMISAWRYPGVTKPGTPFHIPEDTLAELSRISAVA